jgi:hypothetical protein
MKRQERYERPQAEPTLTLEDLAQIVCEGNVEGELQDRVAAVIRTDPRFAQQFEQLEAMATEIGAEDLWEGLERNQEFDRLLETESWKDPAEVLNPHGSDLYEVSYRKLIAVTDVRLGKAADPAPIQTVRDRLLRAEEKLAKDAVFQVAEAVKHLSVDTAEKVIADVRRHYIEKGGADGE